MKYPYETRFGTGWIVFELAQITETVLPGSEPPATPTSYNPRPQVQALGRMLTRYFDGDPTALEQNLALAEQGTTPFLARVYKVVSRIPVGQVMTYKEVATEAGSPNAARAVGQAMARNKFAPLIPCHRVVPSTGGVGNYGGGSAMKQALLEMEGTRG
jgi:methylated-DNA-[protein]-cysteine S-methyltransferase